ncbi:MAG: hypothetical protein V4858_19280 [Pseudomonadota bacterium]
MNPSRRRQLRWIAASLLILIVYFIWTTDKITFQGERTVYTVNCANGAWDGKRCTGEMTAGPRYRFRALKARGEVLFWVLGNNEPSAKLTGCSIQDGRNWTCPVTADAKQSITLGLASGDPLVNPAWPTRPLYSVSKMTWIFLDNGWSVTNVAKQGV